ncbi:MAG: serine/threonine protein kinase [Sandaracinaceae bacterium]|nr:serine/threonine protein kinase [Sandaracinaceae bacterium]
MGEGLERAPGNGGSLVGSTVAGKFVVEARVAAGGMGIIYRARQQPLDRVVALKVLSIRQGDVDEDFERRFYLEAATCAKLNHPNIVVVHDYGRLEPEQGGACFMVMELIEGRTIAEAMREDGPFDAMRTIRVARDIARALRVAHRRDAVHRDLKPSNVMLERTPEGERVKVLDFGLVKILQQEEADTITQEGEFLGSPRYMAPEQIEHAPADARTDLYALGALMFLMLTGEAPFERDSSMNILLAHLHDPVPTFAELGVDVPPELERVIRRCLEKSAEDRHRSAEDLLADLAGVWAQLADSELARSDAWETSTSSEEALRVHASTVSADAMPLESAELESTEPWTRKLAYVALAVGLLAIAAVGTVAWDRRADARTPVAPPVAQEISAPAPAAEPTAVIVPPAPPPADPGHYSLLVESTPPGARLLRGDEELGVTPVAIELDTEALDAEPVTLTLSLAGHHPFTWTQGPLGRDGRIQATLIRRAGGGAPPRAVPPRVEPMPEPEDSPVVLPWARPNPY